MRRLLLCCLILLVPGCTSQHPRRSKTPPTASMLSHSPTKPANVQAQVQGSTISITWDAITGASSYHMQWASESKPEVLLGQAFISTPNLQIPDLESGRYIIQVAQITAQGSGPVETVKATVDH